jgi:hypothetical protein
MNDTIAGASPVDQPVRRLACSVPPEYRVPLRDLVATMVGLRNAEERERRPPCVKCGAETAEQAETMCQPVDCDCPGCRLWPDA